MFPHMAQDNLSTGTFFILAVLAVIGLGATVGSLMLQRQFGHAGLFALIETVAAASAAAIFAARLRRNRR